MLLPNLTSLLSVQSVFIFSPAATLSNSTETMAFSDPLLSSLTKAKLAPGVLVPTGFKPVTELKISFSGKDVKDGNYLKTGETKKAPSVSFTIEVKWTSTAHEV